MVPSKGTTFYYTTNAGHTAKIPSALPTVYPLAGGDLAVWTQLVCVEDVSGVDKFSQEKVEHRCLDITQILVEEFPTGFIKADPIMLTLIYAPALENVMRAANLNRTKFRLLMMMALDDTQTSTPDVFAWKCRCTSCEPVFDANGKPVDLKLEFTLYDDTGVYQQGS